MFTWHFSVKVVNFTAEHALIVLCICTKTFHLITQGNDEKLREIGDYLAKLEDYEDQLSQGLIQWK